MKEVEDSSVLFKLWGMSYVANQVLTSKKLSLIAVVTSTKDASHTSRKVMMVLLFKSGHFSSTSQAPFRIFTLNSKGNIPCRSSSALKKGKDCK